MPHLTIRGACAFLAIPVFIAVCILALLANEQAALSGAYANADQALASILPH